LHGGRFAVELTWTDPAGAEHAAFTFAHGDGAGYFAFYSARDLQATLKILDGRAVNGRFWLFATWLTHLGTTLTVTDSATATVHRYHKPAGEFASVIDLTSLRLADHARRPPGVGAHQPLWTVPPRPRGW
jgi:hypothetical protein